jgi:tetratricopeptide (TPR) repeat protein
MTTLARPIASLCLALALSLTGAVAQEAPPQGAPEARPDQGGRESLPGSMLRKPPRDANALPPTPELRDELLQGLYADLAKAGSADQAENIGKTIDRMWTVSGSPTTDLLLQRAIIAFNAKQIPLAQRLLDTVVELQPDYAEAFNRRAFVYYSQKDYSRALADLRRVLALDPRHPRALEGLAQILRGMREKKASLDAFRELLKVNPHAPGAKEAVEELKREVEGQGI